MDKVKKNTEEYMLNRQFGRLTVLERKQDHYLPCGQHYDSWLCKCSCGNIKTVSGRHLRMNEVQSCGCLNEEVKFKHGQSHTKLHNIWLNIKARCTNERNKNYNNYGGRGIKVCDEWIGKNGFINFYNWSYENGYKEGLSIDRINNDGNYCPENCRWVTMKVQANNTRKNRYITYNGERRTLSEWSEITGISAYVLQNRLSKLGWSVERAMTEEPRVCKRRNI